MIKTILTIAALLLLASPAMAVTYKVTYVVQDSNNIPLLATEDGWTSTVTADNGNLMDNPVSAEDYLRDKFEAHVKKYPINLYSRIIKKQKRNERDQAVTGFSSVVDSGLTVTKE